MGSLTPKQFERDSDKGLGLRTPQNPFETGAKSGGDALDNFIDSVEQSSNQIEAQG